MKTRPGGNLNSSAGSTFVVFTVGGQRLATRLEEVGGVWPWTEPTLVPSRTPHIDAVMRHGEDYLPVLNLASLLNVSASGMSSFCLVLKTHKGPVVVRIDETVPSMHTLDDHHLDSAGDDPSLRVGICRIDGQDVPIYSFTTLGAV